VSDFVSLQPRPSNSDACGDRRDSCPLATSRRRDAARVKPAPSSHDRATATRAVTDGIRARGGEPQARRRAPEARALQPRPSVAREWRRERDSNPRYPFGYNGFQDRRHQPLGHPSAAADFDSTASRVSARRLGETPRVHLSVGAGHTGCDGIPCPPGRIWVWLAPVRPSRRHRAAGLPNATGDLS
jgi:hypothetical protein